MDEAHLKGRLWALQLDDPDSSLPFSRRLARDNGWSHEFALRAIEEYRRFVFLAAVAGHSVTPSDEVDQVWHLHLCYTRSYWEEMCGEVLEKPLHHGPTRGGDAEGAKFDDWYRATLASYVRVFGEQPPPDLWPAPSQRFAARRWRRVDVNGAWLVSRRTVKRQLLAASVVVGLLAAASCSSMFGRNIAGTVALAAAVGLIGLIVTLLRQAAQAANQGPSAPGGDRGGCGDVSHHPLQDKQEAGDHPAADGGDGGGGGGGGGGCGSGCGGGCGD